MRTIYIDNNNICYPTDDGTRTAIETDALDNVEDLALPFYKYYPASEGKVELIQCFDSPSAELTEKAFQSGVDSMDDTIAGLIDEIALLCEELIGE